MLIMILRLSVFSLLVRWIEGYACTDRSDCEYAGCNNHKFKDYNWYLYGCNYVNGYLVDIASGNKLDNTIYLFYSSQLVCVKGISYAEGNVVCPEPCPSSCPSGQYILNCVCTSCTATCSAGTYQTTSCTSTTNRVCSACPANSYCLGGTSIATCTATCSAGTYETTSCTSTTNRVCSACLANSYCLGGTSIATCTATCSAGTYQTTSCTSTTNRVCSACPANSYCLGGTSIATCTAPCTVAGTYESVACTSSTNRVCSACLANSYCLGGTSIATCTAPCTVAGTYESVACTASTNRVCSSCTNLISNATYTGVGTSATNCPWVCNSGFYLVNNGTCVACPVDSWCSGNILNTCPSNSGSGALSISQNQCLCKPGYFGNGSRTGTSPCPVCTTGNYCPGGNSNLSISCPINFTSNTGSDDLSDCYCNPGYELKNGQCQLCPSTGYCVSGTLNLCPSQSSSPTGSSQIGSCVCNAGFYGPNGGSCAQCPLNYFCPGGNVAVACTANAVSPVQSTNASACYCDRGYQGVNNQPCVACPSGTWCWTGILNMCPTNTSSPPMSSFWFNCTCMPGFTGPDGQACAPCAPGTFKGYNGSDACAVCASNTYCPQGSKNQTFCPSNTNSPVGSSASTQCIANAGYFGPAGSAVTPCTATYFCPAGSTTQTSCSVNNYCPAGSASPTPCQTCDQVYKSTCSSTGLSVDTVTCSCNAGFYLGAPSAAVKCTACPQFTMSAQNNDNTSIAACRCVAGYVCSYKKRIYVMVTLNIPLSQFDAAAQQAFKETVAKAANVTSDKVTIVGITSPPAGGRRLLSLKQSITQIKLYIADSTHVCHETIRKYSSDKKYKSVVQDIEWEIEDFIDVEKDAHNHLGTPRTT